MSTPLSSAELNVLIYRYLVESGFSHSAHSFGYEALVHKHGVRDREIPVGMLISIVQKGLQYVELETNLKEDGRNLAGDFSLLAAAEILTKSTQELRELAQERREKRKAERQQFYQRLSQNNAGPSMIDEQSVRTLEGHRGEVFACSWSPAERDLLATSASDNSARIWQADGAGPAIELHHAMPLHKDVSAVDWSPDGNSLVTGAHDGVARIWSSDGILRQTLTGHTGPIMSVKWSRKGEYVLVGSLDKTATVWHVKSGQMKQRLSEHTLPVLDVDWKNNAIFATCSSDRTVNVYKVGEDEPLKSLSGHTKDVNSVKWDPQGRLLASCSDDGTVRVWSLHSDTCLHTLRGHEKEIYCMKWAPSATASLFSEAMAPVSLLATGSFDASIRLWNAENGECLGILQAHTQPVYSLAFSPDGKLLASGSFDRRLLIWSVLDMKLIRTLENTGGIFDVSWNCTGDKVAACADDKSVTVIDIHNT